MRDLEETYGFENDEKITISKDDTNLQLLLKLAHLKNKLFVVLNY